MGKISWTERVSNDQGHSYGGPGVHVPFANIARELILCAPTKVMLMYC